MKKILIVFDIDGTLINSASVHGILLERAMRNHGIKEIDTNWHGYKHHTDSFIIQENLRQNSIHVDFDHYLTRIDQNLFNLYEEAKPIIAPFAGISDLFQALHTSDHFDYCFATGSLRKSAELKMSQVLPFQVFQNRISSASEGITREEIVLSAIKNRLGKNNFGNSYRIISVGDGIWDQNTARKLNIEFIPVGPEQNSAIFNSDCYINLDGPSGLVSLLEVIATAHCR